MKNIEGIPKAHRVNCPPRIGLVVCNDLKDGASAKSLQGFYGRVFLAVLRSVQGLSNMAPNCFRKRFKISPRRPDPPNGFGPDLHYISIRILV